MQIFGHCADKDKLDVNKVTIESLRDNCTSFLHSADGYTRAGYTNEFIS